MEEALRVIDRETFARFVDEVENDRKVLDHCLFMAGFVIGRELIGDLEITLPDFLDSLLYESIACAAERHENMQRQLNNGEPVIVRLIDEVDTEDQHTRTRTVVTTEDPRTVASELVGPNNGNENPPTTPPTAPPSQSLRALRAALDALGGECSGSFEEKAENDVAVLKLCNRIAAVVVAKQYIDEIKNILLEFSSALANEAWRCKREGYEEALRRINEGHVAYEIVDGFNEEGLPVRRLVESTGDLHL